MIQGIVKTPAVVLHRLPFSDTSMVVKVFTPELGLVSLLAKGLRRKDNRMRPILEPLTHCELVLSLSPRRELQSPREAHLLHSWSRLRANLDAWAQAEVMAESVLRLGAGGSHHEGIFQLLVDSLALLEHNGSDDPKVLPEFLRALAHELGYTFSLQSCNVCDRSLGNDLELGDLDPGHGGGICVPCLGLRKPLWPATLRRSLLLREWGGNSDVMDCRRQEEFFLYYLALHQGVPQNLRSPANLAVVRGLPSAPTFQPPKEMNP